MAVVDRPASSSAAADHDAVTDHHTAAAGAAAGAAGAAGAAAAAVAAAAEHGRPTQRRQTQDQDQLSEQSLEDGAELDGTELRPAHRSKAQPEPQPEPLPEPQCDAAAPREAAGGVEPMDQDDDITGQSEQNGLLDSKPPLGAPTSPATALDMEPGASLAQTYVTFFKSFVGIAILGLPHAFSLAGYILAPLGFLFVCYLSFYCMRLLLACKTQLAASGQQLSLTDSTQGIGYQDVARLVLGSRGQVLTEFCLVTSQMGFLVGYLIFIGANAPPALHALGGPRISSSGCVLVVSLALAPLVCLRSIKKLSSSALLANLAILFGIGESKLHGCVATGETVPVHSSS